MDEEKEELQPDSAREKPVQSAGPDETTSAITRDGSARRKFPWWGWLCILVLAVTVSVILTYTLTANAARNRRVQLLQPVTTEVPDENAAREIRNVQTLIRALQEKSYYANQMGDLGDEKLLKAAMNAYIESTGDVYAAFYTEEEYQALMTNMAGNQVGIGVTITKDYVDFGSGTEEEAYRIEEVYEGSGSMDAGLAVGEWICAVKEDGIYRKVGELGMQAAANMIRGTEGTQVELMIRRSDGTLYYPAVKRSAVTTHSVRSSWAENDQSVAVIRISNFDYTTPTQFVEAVETAKANGALHYVFDVRGNPGGELASIYAVLSNFLQEDDLVLAMVDANGERQKEYRMKPVTYTGSSSGCTVTKDQIGQYRDLDFVILCDENTASAAEVFTATLQDFGLAKKIVGQKTFGKGIVQGYSRLELEDFSGYLKVTVAGYVTQRGESYHGIGILPDVESILPETVRGKSTTFLPWENDTQLQEAVALFQS